MSASLNDPSGRWFDYHGAAEYLGVSKRWIEKRAQKGVIPSYKRGRLVRLDRRDLDALNDAQRRSGC